MCKIFATLDETYYTRKTRSIRLGGHVTSIRLEALFWEILEEIAASEQTTLGHFLTSLYDEFLEVHGEIANFTALLRCASVCFIADSKSNAQTKARFVKVQDAREHFTGTKLAKLVHD